MCLGRVCWKWMSKYQYSWLQISCTEIIIIASTVLVYFFVAVRLNFTSMFWPFPFHFIPFCSVFFNDPSMSIFLPSTGLRSQMDGFRGEVIMLPLTCLVHYLWLLEDGINTSILEIRMTCGCVTPCTTKLGNRYCFLSQFCVLTNTQMTNTEFRQSCL